MPRRFPSSRPSRWTSTSQGRRRLRPPGGNKLEAQKRDFESITSGHAEDKEKHGITHVQNLTLKTNAEDELRDSQANLEAKDLPVGRLTRATSRR